MTEETINSKALEVETRAALRDAALDELADTGVIGIDPEGVICLFNRTAEQIFKYHRSRILGQPMELLMPERLRSLHHAHRRRWFQNPRPRPMGKGMELTAVDSLGFEFPITVYLSELVRLPQGVFGIAVVRLPEDHNGPPRPEAQANGS